MWCSARCCYRWQVMTVLVGVVLVAGPGRALPSAGRESQNRPGTTSGALDPGERVTVAGVVLDKHSGKGLPDVRIHFVGAPRDDGITGANGRFSTVTHRGRFGQWQLIFPAEQRSDQRVVPLSMPSDISPARAGRLELHVAPEEIPTQRQVRGPGREFKSFYRLRWDDQHPGLFCDRIACVVCDTHADEGNRDDGPAGSTVYENDLRAFFAEIDKSYSFLDLKGIRAAWSQAQPELLRRARQCTSDTEFLRIVIDAIRVLRDGHLGFVQAKVELPPLPKRYFPGVNLLPAADERVVVMYAPRYLTALTTGTVVTKIDGVDARRFLEQRSAEAWDAGGFFSSPQRARMFEYRLALRGEQGQEHTIHYRNEGEEHSVTLACERTARGWPHTYNLPDDLKRVGRSFFYTKLADEIGYMYLRRVDPSIPDGIDEALGAHPKLRGWIVDMRGNGGGGYDRDLIEKIKRVPRPVAVLIDAGCISAGETLARDFRRYGDARLFGARSGGSSSSKKTWSFPSGIASIRFPVRSRWRSDGKPIEFNGIEPDVEVEAVPEELQAGHNSAILRAQEYIIGQTKERSPEEGDDHDYIVGWYELAWGSGALIPIFKIDGLYYTVCRGFEIPLKECPGGLEWALAPSSMEGTTFEVALGSGPAAIRIVDRQRQDLQESYVPGQRQRITRTKKPADLRDTTAPRPETLDDFQGLYQPVWLAWYRWEIRKDGSRYLFGEQEYRGSEPPVVWRTRGELRELTPLTDRLGFTGFDGDDSGQLVYNAPLRRFEFVKMETGARMPLARIAPSTAGDAAPPSVIIGIPAWH